MLNNDDLVNSVLDEINGVTPTTINTGAVDSDLVSDILDDMESSMANTFSHEEAHITEESNNEEEDNDCIDCPSCGSIAYWNEEAGRYVCPDCGWVQQTIEEQATVAVAQESTNNSVVNDVLDDMDSDLQNVVDEVTTFSNDSAFVDDTTLRFKGAPWYDIVQSKTIILAGLGGIGSWLSLFLARMKPKAMFLYDDDVVESVNMSGQLYGGSSFGQPKVTASIGMSIKLADYYDTFGNRQKFTEESEASDIMICGFDSMKARKTFYNSWKKHIEGLTPIRKGQCLFLDGRLSAEDMQVFCITGNDTKSMQEYEFKWLFDDSEADATVCSYKQTTYCAAMIGSLITNLFVNFCTNLGEPVFERPLPFYTTYDAELMQFKTEM